MIDPELSAKLDDIRMLAERAATDAAKTRSYLFWTGVVTLVLFVLPLVGIALIAPQFLSTYTASLNGLGY